MTNKYYVRAAVEKLVNTEVLKVNERQLFCERSKWVIFGSWNASWTVKWSGTVGVSQNVSREAEMSVEIIELSAKE